jgi:WD40 repeat protein
VALDELGYDAFGGREDGKITCFDMDSDKVWYQVPGHGRVLALAADGDKMQALRGSVGGRLDMWDLNGGDVGRHLLGHTDDVKAVRADWAGGRAVSVSLDRQVIVWDLTKAVAVEKLSGHEAGVTALAVDWQNGMVMTGSEDETVKLWSLNLPEGKKLMTTLEGHSDVVRFLSFDWDRKLALSVSAWDHTVKLWDLTTYECTSTFKESREAQVLAVHVDWPSMQAMCIQDDGVASVWDLKDPSRNPLTTSSLPNSIKAAVIAPGPDRSKQRRPKTPA